MATLATVVTWGFQDVFVKDKGFYISTGETEEPLKEILKLQGLLETNKWKSWF